MVAPLLVLWSGARPQTGAILAKLTELKEAQDALNERQSHLEQIDAELSAIRRTAAR